MWDFSLTPKSGVSGTYCFRIVKSDNTSLDTYTIYPELTVTGPTGPVMDDVMRGGMYFSNGSKQNYKWAE